MENKVLKDINPRACGESQCSPGHSWPDEHWNVSSRPYYLLHYVISGKGVFETEEGIFDVRPGQIFVIIPHKVVSYRADEQDPWQYCWICFESTLDLSDVLSKPIITAPECGHIFNALRNCANIAIDREWYICGKIYELLSLLETQKSTSKSRAHHYVRIAQNYIDMNYRNPDLRVEKLATDLNLDRAYFSKIFRKYTGKTPQQYIVDFRLDLAADIIVHQELSPGEAAGQVGYNNIFNFSRMFKKRFGVSPSFYLDYSRRDSGIVYR